MTDESPTVEASTYLAPYKIALLSLITLYCEGYIPRKERMNVISKILPYIDLFGREQTYGLTDKSNKNGDQGEVENGLNLPLSELKQLIGADNMSTMPGRTIYELVLEKVWQLNSLDAFHTFMYSLRSYITSGKPEDLNDERAMKLGLSKLLSSSSILGSFFRKSGLAFDYLSFEDFSSLWRALVSYRNETFSDYKHIHAPEFEEIYDELQQDLVVHDVDIQGFLENDYIRNMVNLEIGESSAGPKILFIANQDLEYLLEYQVEAFENYGGPMPHYLRETLNEMIRRDVMVPSSAYYVRYLEAYHDKDYERSYELLHQYFDYTMYNRDRTFYQYALFTLAGFQASFKCHTECLRATEEAIAVARENKDIPCLHYILSWLYGFLKDNPRLADEFYNKSFTSDEHLLQFLKTKSKDVSPGLHATAHQCEAAHAAADLGNVSAAMESIVKSSYINMTLNKSNKVVELIVLLSAIWGRLGLPRMANIYLDSYFETPSDYRDGKSDITARILKAEILYDQGELFEAEKILDELEASTKGSPVDYEMWLPHLLLIQAKTCLSKNRLSDAQVRIDQLSRQSITSTSLEMDIEHCRIRLLVAQGNTSLALEQLSNFIHTRVESGADIMFQIKFRILYARIVYRVSNPSRALSLTMKCIAMAEKAIIIPLALEATCLLSDILNSLEQYTDALAIMDATMPRIFECSSNELVADSYASLADSNMGIVGKVSLEENYNDDEEENDVVTSTYSTISGSKIEIRLPSRKTLLYRTKTYLEEAGHRYHKSRNYKAMGEMGVKMILVKRLIAELEKKIAKSKCRTSHNIDSEQYTSFQQESEKREKSINDLTDWCMGVLERIQKQ
ncbi:hypothetical protein NADFUDRAFT_48801 [Nadsonia fulvescens var. elongata DSM 6958]|uniref:Anaphase-promoting complex subunit 5 n=1 Tax=Nadsonia fulvescens var. elongata DSM 6958 TaxID=857566 RepID=A0A1E3PRV3_9ASCO|nr:hypothetical protein NADFUDRAFT_48801 [Nadsonia fulvescens var. elongata DSM 6958]